MNFRRCCTPTWLIFWMGILVPMCLTAQTDTTVGRSDIKDLLKIRPEKSEPTVFTAARQSQKLSESPVTIHLITDRDIKIRGYLSLNDILRDLPEFKINEFSSYETYNNVSVRGINLQDKFIIMMDGVRISSPTNDPLPIGDNFPVNLIRQVEIVTGPVSALYGADALTGVINIVTYKPEEIDRANVNLHTGTHGYYRAGLLFSPRIHRKLDLRLTGQYTYDALPNMAHFYPTQFQGIESLKTGTFRSVFGDFTNVRNLQPDFDQQVRFYNWEVFARYSDVSFSVHQNVSQVPTATSFVPNNSVYNSENFLRQSVTKFNMTYKKNLTPKLSNSSTLFYSVYEMSSLSSYRNIYSGFNNGYKYAYGSMMQFDQMLTFIPNEKWNLTGGMNFQSFYSIPKGDDLDRSVNPSLDINAKILGTPFDAKFYQIRYYNAGAFLQLIYRPFKKMIVNLGLRYDYNTRFSPLLNPRIGLNYSPVKNTRLKISYTEGFLAPSPYYVYRRYGTFFSSDSGRSWSSPFWFLPNFDLRPTTLQSLEGGLSYTPSRFSFQLTGYYMWVNDVIFQGSDADNGNRYNGRYLGFPVENIQIFVNSGHIRSYGLVLNTSYKLRINEQSEWKPQISFLWSDGTEQNANVTLPIPEISPLQLRVISDLVWRKWSLSLRWILMNEQRTIAVNAENNGRKTLPGYGVVNATVGFEPNKNMRFNLIIQNLTDQRYFNTTDLAFRNSEILNGSPQLPLRFFFGAYFSL